MKPPEVSGHSSNQNAKPGKSSKKQKTPTQARMKALVTGGSGGMGIAAVRRGGRFAIGRADAYRSSVCQGSAASLVPRAGLEPAHLAAGDFESPAYTEFATEAHRNLLAGQG